MERQQIDYLLKRLRAGEATPAETAEIENLLTRGIIAVDDINDYADLQDAIGRMKFPDPPISLDSRFYAMLDREQANSSHQSWKEFFTIPAFVPKFAFASVLLMIGFAVGYLLRPSSPDPDHQIELLSEQVSELQEMMMLSLLEKGSATERLKAVGLTQEMDEASKKVTTALIQTLNQDENINVRLAALEALKPYASDSSVREALIRSISKQDSPLVQISLAELMVALQEKAAVPEFETLMRSENTPPEIKKKIQESIDVLI